MLGVLGVREMSEQAHLPGKLLHNTLVGQETQCSLVLLIFLVFLSDSLNIQLALKYAGGFMGTNNMKLTGAQHFLKDCICA